MLIGINGIPNLQQQTVVYTKSHANAFFALRQVGNHIATIGQLFSQFQGDRRRFQASTIRRVPISLLTYLQSACYRAALEYSKSLDGINCGRGIAIHLHEKRAPPGTFVAVAYQGMAQAFTDTSPSKEQAYVNSLGSPSLNETTHLPWFALHVKSRRENLVAGHLEGQGYECLLPLYKSVRRWSDRMKELEQPLFPGYLFCRFDFQNRGPLLMTPGVIQIVGIGRTPMPVDETELETVRQVVLSGRPNQPWPYLEVGERVRVNYGSLSGVEGILVNFKGSHRVVMSVTLLQRSVAMEIDLEGVTPVREARPAQIAREFTGQVAMVPTGSR